MSLASNFNRVRPAQGQAGSAEGKDASSDGVPLGIRLRAWWHGSSVRELLAEEARRGNGRDIQILREVPVARAAETVSAAAEPEAPACYWSPACIAVTEALFGHGEIVPGGTARTLDMIGAFGLGQEVNVLNVGAGLGGSARAIAGKYEGWVTAYEANPELAQAALDPARNRQAMKSSGSSLKPMKIRMKLSDKATILHADLETVEIKAGVYDCAYSRDALFTVSGKGRLLEGIFEGLKPFGPLVFTDYFLTEDAHRDPRVRAWMESEPSPVHPWTPPEAARTLTEIGYDLRVDQDITAQHRHDLFRGFSTFIATHEVGGITGEVAEGLLGVVELWTRRVAVIDAGLVTVRKFVALRPKDT